MKTFLGIFSLCLLAACANGASGIRSAVSTESSSWDSANSRIAAVCYSKMLKDMALHDCTQEIFDETVIPLYPDLYQSWRATQKEIFVRLARREITKDLANERLSGLMKAYFAEAETRAHIDLEHARATDVARSAAVSSALANYKPSDQSAVSAQSHAAILMTPASKHTTCRSVGAEVHCVTD